MARRAITRPPGPAAPLKRASATAGSPPADSAGPGTLVRYPDAAPPAGPARAPSPVRWTCRRCAREVYPVGAHTCGELGTGAGCAGLFASGGRKGARCGCDVDDRNHGQVNVTTSPAALRAAVLAEPAELAHAEVYRRLTARGVATTVPNVAKIRRAAGLERTAGRPAQDPNDALLANAVRALAERHQVSPGEVLDAAERELSERRELAAAGLLGAVGLEP